MTKKPRHQPRPAFMIALPDRERSRAAIDELHTLMAPRYPIRLGRGAAVLLAVEEAVAALRKAAPDPAIPPTTVTHPQS